MLLSLLRWHRIQNIEQNQKPKIQKHGRPNAETLKTSFSKE